VADRDLALRALRLVDQDQPAPGRERRHVERRRGRGLATGYRGAQRRGDLFGARRRDRPGHAHHHVVRRPYRSVECGQRLQLDATQRRLGAQGGAGVRVTRRAHPVEVAIGERVVVVAHLVQLVSGLAQQDLVLARAQQRIGHHRRGQRQRAVEVTLEAGAAQAQPVAIHLDLDGGADLIDGGVQLGARQAARAAAGQLGRMSGHALAAGRIERHAHPDRRAEPAERQAGRGLEVERRAHVRAPPSSSPSSPTSSSSDSSGSIRIDEQCSATR
jgi:hypothetical protein